MEEAEKMPVVILSLHQKWWQKMAAGEKVLELRKTKYLPGSFGNQEL